MGARSVNLYVPVSLVAWGSEALYRGGKAITRRGEDPARFVDLLDCARTAAVI